MKNKLVLIGGGTASGKTLIAKKVLNSLQKPNLSIAMLNMDNYYKDITQFSNKKVTEINWDNPNSIEWEKLLIDIDKLLSGERVIRKKYDYNTGYYSDEEIVIEAADYIIVEGLFALYNEELNKKSTIRIFVAADADTRVLRRMKRDRDSRYEKFIEKDFFDKWAKVLKPMHNKYIAPTSKNAHIIIQTTDNEYDENKLKESINLIVKLIK